MYKNKNRRKKVKKMSKFLTEKSQEKSQENNLDPKEVFRATDAEMAQTRVTQMFSSRLGRNSLRNELYCPVCQSGAIINPKRYENMKNKIIEKIIINYSSYCNWNIYVG